ncbi:uncharacterized protein LOC110042081 [Orbicella faveolata]|uniref:uncharacterized protein LOC110042076 n=1 Tax=Orbicella faveolata TaxID=48498 RepID=UPI0009E5B4AC|nr:uncharacterized protein LOC110042076 [Orbicella faveolata]XP_020603078.1 uncharacterized protein LOC110042081 [Orbicella faveolata]
MEAFKEKIAGLGPSRSDSRTFTQETTFRVKYLGFCLNSRAGVEGIRAAVSEIKKTGGQRDHRNTIQTNFIKISDQGVSFVERKRERSVPLAFIPLRKISYGLIYEKDSNIFAFNHHVSQNHVECHAVVCESELKAREISETLYASFRADHFENLRKEREKVKRCLQTDSIDNLTSGGGQNVNSQ